MKKNNKIIKVASLLVATLGLGLLVAGCSTTNKDSSSTPKDEYIASDGSYTVGKTGAIKTKSIDKNRATVDVYFDPLCPSCGDFERTSGDYLAKQIASGKVLVTYHPMMFLDSASSDKYSTRASAYTLGVVEYAPSLAQKFSSELFAKSFQPEEGSNYRPVSNKKLEAMFLGLGGTKKQAKKIDDNLNRMGVKSYNTTRTVMNDKALIKKSPTGELYTPFVIPNAVGKNDGKALEFSDNMLPELKDAIGQITK